MPPFFSIVIPSLNEEVNLPILLASIARQSFKDFEVLVSDGNSKDRTKEVCQNFAEKFPNFLFFENNVRNVGAARNMGAEKAKGKYLIFFDADVEISDDFLDKINKLISQNNLDALTVWNRAKNKEIIGSVILGFLNISMTLFQKIKPNANGPCIIIKKSTFDKIHAFDDSIVFGEDFDLIQRAVKSKAKFSVFSKPILYVSTRRFEKEGLILSLYKSLKAILHQLFFGPIRKPIFEYEMGGQYYKIKKNN